jgi:nucleoside-triphosphatase
MSCAACGRRVLVEGRPGAGKTTALDRLAGLLRDLGVPIVGFLTKEIRTDGRRVGFEIETFDGERGVLAHIDRGGQPRVGRYGVDVETFERLALPALGHAPPGGVVVIDELGKMELLSTRFRDAVTAVFDGPQPIAATVQSARHPFTDALKARLDVDTLRLTARNRAALPAELADRLAGDRYRRAR